MVENIPVEVGRPIFFCYFFNTGGKSFTQRKHFFQRFCFLKMSEYPNENDGRLWNFLSLNCRKFALECKKKSEISQIRSFPTFEKFWGNWKKYTVVSLSNEVVAKKLICKTKELKFPWKQKYLFFYFQCGQF